MAYAPQAVVTFLTFIPNTHPHFNRTRKKLGALSTFLKKKMRQHFHIILNSIFKRDMDKCGLVIWGLPPIDSSAGEPARHAPPRARLFLCPSIEKEITNLFLYGHSASALGCDTMAHARPVRHQIVSLSSRSQLLINSEQAADEGSSARALRGHEHAANVGIVEAAVRRQPASAHRDGA